ncbi:phosphatase PAP2 family protein [Luteolibacter soli]|uniref:Phosphatase PAP2 family protein n=1 Tax=Luteolibacter soli TaxID=3135280 RepID=A0ABU9AUU8_9BACT
MNPPSRGGSTSGEPDTQGRHRPAKPGPPSEGPRMGAPVSLPRAVPGLSLLVAAFAALILFVILGIGVRADTFAHLDPDLLLALQGKEPPSDPLGSLRAAEMARDITALGSFSILTLVSTAGLGAALLSGKGKATLMGLLSIGSAMAAMNLLKVFYSRPRPDLVAHGTFVSGASFPSGHTTMATVIYLTLGLMIARTSSRRATRFFVMTLSLLIPVCVGISRVYLGVHWPTDVIGGWMLGAVWGTLYAFATKWMENRGKPSSPHEAS